MDTLYWSIVALLFGACVGSFANVVIYRWPQGLSLLKPRRSFCPACSRPIAWYDNIPVVSYVFLRGRCRHCRGTISLQYPFIELATALTFLITYDAFFVHRQRLGITDLSVDWPVLIGHWLLWGGMIVLAVMDLEAYLVDINVTWGLLIVGVVSHAIWTPARSVDWIRPGPTQATFAVAVSIGLLVGALIFLRRAPDEEKPPSSDEASSSGDESPPQVASDALGVWRWVGLAIGIGVVAALVAATATSVEQMPLRRPMLPMDHHAPYGGPAPTDWHGGTLGLVLGIAALFVGLTLAASRPSPEADTEIVEAIHDEAPQARRNALRELMFLLPAIILGIAVLWAFMSSSGPTAERMAQRLLDWSPTGEWRPILGLTTALTGWVIGGAIGWFSRIFFTLALGKEALGMGDIHILAAAGAVAGWPVAFLGFFMAACLALLGLLVIHFTRQSRALPYGPWLALGFLVASIFQDRLLLHVYPLVVWLWE